MLNTPQTASTVFQVIGVTDRKSNTAVLNELWQLAGESFINIILFKSSQPYNFLILSIFNRFANDKSVR